MDTKLLHPAHTLLGTTPETSLTGRIKVIIAGLASIILCIVMLFQDISLIQHSKQVISRKIKSTKRTRRNTLTSTTYDQYCH